LLIGVRMSHKIDCENIELKTIEHSTMHEPELVRQWYCYATEINDYIDDCPNDCPYFIQKK